MYNVPNFIGRSGSTGKKTYNEQKITAKLVEENVLLNVLLQPNSK